MNKNGPYPRGFNGSNYQFEDNIAKATQLEKSANLKDVRRKKTDDILNRIDKNRIDVKRVIPEVNYSADRLKSIIENTPAIFKIDDNVNADGSEPILELSAFNPIDSGSIYNEIGNKYGIDPDWLKAIAYLENTHGYYDGIPPFNLVNTSYRPMNVQYKTWKPLAEGLGFSEWQVQYRVECNVELAALILKRIVHRVQNPTIEKVASIYNFLGREQVSDYGARAGEIYRERLWEK